MQEIVATTGVIIDAPDAGKGEGTRITFGIPEVDAQVADVYRGNLQCVPAQRATDEELARVDAAIARWQAAQGISPSL